MACKNCGYENKLGVRYCQRCGQYIEPKRTLAQENVFAKTVEKFDNYRLALKTTEALR